MIQSITVDLIPNGKMPMLHASQYDDGRQVRINLTENRQAYTLTGNEVLSLAVRKADNTLVTMDIANTFGGKSYVEFSTTEQTCAVAGLSFGELTITNNGTKVGSLNFYLAVEVSPEQGGVSQSEINNLNRQIDDHIDEVLPDMVEEVAPAIVEEVAPAIVREVAPSVVEDVAPAILDRLAPSAVAEAAPAVVAELVPPAVAEVAPSVVREVAGPIVEELVPIAVGDNYYNKTQTNEKITELIDDSEASASKTYSSNKVVALLGNKADATELVDIRTGADGKTYASAGNAVRSQISNLNEIIGSNMLSLTEGAYIAMKDPETAISDTPVSYTNGACLFTPCKKGDRFSIYGTPLTAIGAMKTYAFTDINKISVLRSMQANIINGLTVTAPVDGYFVVNFDKTSPYKVFKSSVSIEETVENNISNLTDIISKNSNETNVTASETESNLVYSLENPYGATLNNYSSNTYYVKSGDVLKIKINAVPANYKYQLAYFYDANDNFIGYIGKSTDITILVPPRAVKMKISASNSNLPTISVKKLAYKGTDNIKTVSVVNDVVTITNAFYIIAMSKHGHNNLFDIASISDKLGNVIYTADSDWQGPYIVSAKYNADGDAIQEGKTYTGGNHAYSFNGATGTPTARTASIKIFADGVEITDNNMHEWHDKVEIKWTNYVQGWNTKKENGSGREILKETPCWIFDNYNKIDVSNEITALEDIYIDNYYGMQMQALWCSEGIWIPSADRQIIPTSVFTPEGLGTRFEGYETTAIDEDVIIKMGFNPLTDLGTGSGINDDSLKTTRIHTSTSKLYFYMMYKMDLNQDEIASYNGYYKFIKP